MTIKRKPEGVFCYVTHIFSGSLDCPNYVDGVELPFCHKFQCGLKWNVSGHVLKCDKCLEEERK